MKLLQRQIGLSIGLSISKSRLKFTSKSACLSNVMSGVHIGSLLNIPWSQSGSKSKIFSTKHFLSF